MEKQQFTEIEKTGTDMASDKEAQDYRAEESIPEKGDYRDLQTIILQMDKNEDEDSIDLVNVVEDMGRRWKAFAYLLVIAVCIGFLIGAVITAGKSLLGKSNYASAVVSFHFDGIDEGLDPNGGLFDVTKMKSTEVVSEALSELGWEGKNIEEIRSRLKLEGVIPDSVKQQIAVINTVSEDAAEYYTNIQDLNYFPSEYTVTLQRCRGMSGKETRELLDAILSSYRDYFMDSYADSKALGTVSSMLDITTYDYMQASDMIEQEISMMQEYVEAKQKEAPDFRAGSTGLSFGDLASAINAVRQLDLNNYVSFIQSNNLTKDAATQIDYYNYQVTQYNMKLQELQTQLADIEHTIAAYQKDPVIVMSNQESVTETSQKNEYYDKLLERKLALNEQISSINTDLNQAYAMIAVLESNDRTAKEEDYAYADDLLDGLLNTVQTWAGLAEETAEEYYQTDLYANAYQILIPAQYNAAGSFGELCRMMLICGGVAALAVIILWGMIGLKGEIIRMRKDASEQK